MGSDDNNVYALDANTGALVWTYSTGGAVEDSPAIVNGVLYISSVDGNLYALKLSEAVPPVAGFTASPLSGRAPLTVNFTDISTGYPNVWAWFFGDENYGGCGVNLPRMPIGRHDMTTAVSRYRKVASS